MSQREICNKGLQQGVVKGIMMSITAMQPKLFLVFFFLNVHCNILCNHTITPATWLFCCCYYTLQIPLDFQDSLILLYYNKKHFWYLCLVSFLKWPALKGWYCSTAMYSFAVSHSIITWVRFYLVLHLFGHLCSTCVWLTVLLWITT